MNRRLLIRTAVCVAANNLVACGSINRSRKQSFDAIVTAGERTHGSAPTFPSIQAALDAAPANATQPHRILITRGRWREKLSIDKPFIHLVGTDRSQSVLSYDAYAGQVAPDGQPWGTFRSATLVVRAPDFAASNLTVENSFDYLAYLAKSQGEPTGANRAQAVAMMFDGNSDRAYVEGCNITGYQDTLFANAGRSLFRDCLISGTVDFIFGAGRAVFDKCEILSRYRPTTERQGYVAAPSTLLSQEYGLVFLRCRLIKEAQVPAQSVALGRAWRPTTTFADGRYGNPNAVGMAVYKNCWLDDHIAAEGWDSMDYGARDGSRVALRPDEARFFEYESRGPGAASTPKRRVLSTEEAERYEIVNVLAGWSL